MFIERLPVNPIGIVPMVFQGRKRRLPPSWLAAILHLACPVAQGKRDNDVPASLPGNGPGNRPPCPFPRPAPASCVKEDCRRMHVGDGRNGRITFLAGVHRIRAAAIETPVGCLQESSAQKESLIPTFLLPGSAFRIAQSLSGGSSAPAFNVSPPGSPPFEKTRAGFART